ncbi:AsmA family protein [Occallatibacter savannae]|uniref:AsmA family protein n=1 Tax=Occallatibacter savannae TaxID=1002691 RepID=UPI000D6932CE|nr:AsmA family protein [Occallatibacter savannae]
MRKVLIAIAVIVVVIIAGAAIFVATFDVNRYRGTIQAQLQQHLGRPVQLGDMHLKLFPPSITVQNLAIADDPRFSTDAPFVKASELDVAVKLLPLLHKDVEIQSLNLQQPTVNLIKNKAGQWNFASIGSGSKSSSSQSSNQQFSLGDLVIKDGEISLLDQTQSSTPTLYNHIDVKLSDFSPSTPFNVDATVHMAGAGEQAITLQGKGGPINAQDATLTPFHGTLQLKNVGVSDFTKFLNSPATAGTDGVLTGETKIDSEGGKVTANGQTSIDKAKVRGMELGFPVSAQYDLTDDMPNGAITIRNLTTKLGSTPIDLNGTAQTKSTPAHIDINLRANNVSVAEAAKYAAAAGMALTPGTTVTGTVNANIHAVGSADKPALSGTVSAANLQASGKDLPQPVQIQSINLNLTPSQIQSNPFTIISGQTSANAQLTMRNYTAPSATVDATLKAANAQLPAILAMAKAYGVKSLDKVTGQGTLNLDMHASGAVKSLTAEEIERTLNGTVNVNFNNVKYSGANMSSELSKIAGFLRPGSSQNTSGMTTISKMTGNINVRDGIAETKDLQATLDIGNVGLAGTANLATEALNMRATAVIAQNVSQQVGGQQIGGFMKTALANNQGELVIPAIITGTFSNPHFQPDVQQLAQMRLKGLIPNMNNPTSITGALGGLLGGKVPGQTTTQQPSQQQSPAGAAQQILGGLFGKKKQTTPPKP